DKVLNPPLRHLDEIFSACFSPDGRQVLTCGKDRTARLWDAHTRKPIGPAVAHSDSVGVSGFSPDGKGIATGSDDGLIRICRLAKQQPAGDPLAERGPVCRELRSEWPAGLDGRPGRHHPGMGSRKPQASW